MNNREQRIKNRKEKIKKVIEYLTAPAKAEFWGVTSICEDVCAEKEIGDGLRLAWFSSHDLRPHLWYIKIDSKSNFNTEETEDKIVNEMIDILEEEHGRSYNCLEKDKLCSSEEDCENCEDERLTYPIVNLNSGCYSWGEINIETTYNELLAEVK